MTICGLIYSIFKKLKEVANLFAEGILTGELKHGPLALVEHGLPMLMIVCDDNTFDKCMNAVQQVTARGVLTKMIFSISTFK